MSDQFGPKPVISTTGLVLGLGYFLTSRLQTTWQLYVYCGVIICFVLMAFSFLLLVAANGVGSFYLFALVFGLAYGGMQVLFSPLVAELLGLRSHGVILGTAAFAGSIGAAFGPFISGYIFDLRAYGKLQPGIYNLCLYGRRSYPAGRIPEACQDISPLIWAGRG